MPARPSAPLGVTEQGIFSLDLERDGPHGLVGGTTGSGKSELLRSLIAALAANAGVGGPNDPGPDDRWDDLVAAGSHTEAARQGKQRLEGKTYVVEDGDVLNVRFNV